MFSLDTLQITPEVLSLIAGIDEFKGAWRALGTLAPERLRALRHVATIESIGSSTRIEGSKLSDREVERLLSNLEIGSFASRDEQEVAGYAEVMETVFRAWDDLPFSENYIKQFHRDILRHSGKATRHRGEYKKLSNSVAAIDEQGRQIGIVFETATPFDTPQLMTELVEWFNQARKDGQLHPLLLIAVFTVVFLEIHPFTRKRDREQQGSLLPCTPADPGDDTRTCSELASMAPLLPALFGAAEAPARCQNGA